jgi:adenylate kinase family enzyme
MARRIHIIGSTGSGKTHVACLLSGRLGIPRFDLDDLFWDRSASAYGVRASGEVRDRRLAEIVSGDAWIIEGVYHQWLGPSFDRAHVIHPVRLGS